MTPITGQLDPLIAPVVHAMREVGFDTVASCEGHPEDPHKTRWPVVVLSPVRGIERASSLATSLMSWVQGVGLHGCSVMIEYRVNKVGVSDALVRVEWWTQKPVEEWLIRREGVPS